MSLNSTPSANRLHIGFFGKRNAGKSSLVNRITGQDLAVVSDTKGTTTDPVQKAMELLPLGPVVIIDTPGYDDEGELGELRVRKTRQILNKTDVAVLVLDVNEGLQDSDRELISLFEKKKLPYIIVHNKIDEIHLMNTGNQNTGKLNLNTDNPNVNTDNLNRKMDHPIESAEPSTFVGSINVSAKDGTGIEALKELIGKSVKDSVTGKRLVGDLLKPLDLVVLVVPIDASAPKGRLILPQQQAIRDILEVGAISVVVRDIELEETLQKLGRKPDLVITDSQAFDKVSQIVPEDVPLTSFSILMARFKGFLETAVKGVQAIDELQDGDKILIAEGCTHHRQCEDIGTVKIPNWLKKYTGKELELSFCSGTEFPEDLSNYKLVIHCGGCMLNEREVKYRMECANDQGVPFCNYGTTIAAMQGILQRSIAPVIAPITDKY